MKKSKKKCNHIFQSDECEKCILNSQCQIFNTKANWQPGFYHAKTDQRVKIYACKKFNDQLKKAHGIVDTKIRRKK